MFTLRRNRSLVLKIVFFVPLTWLCVVLYMNTTTKGLSQEQSGRDDQIVYVNENKLPAEDGQIIYEGKLVDDKAPAVKGPPLKDNQPRKKKPTPSGPLPISNFYFFFSEGLKKIIVLLR